MGMLYLVSEGSSARKAGPRIVVEKDGEIIGRLPVRTIDGVVLGRSSQISTAAVFELLELGIPVVYVDDYGKNLGSLCNERQSAARLLRQLEIFRDADKQLALTMEIITEKILNQQNLLRQYTKTKDSDKLGGRIKRLKLQGDKVNSAGDLEEIRGLGEWRRRYILAPSLSFREVRTGFFHSNDGRKDSLIFDLMELFRQPVIDRFVLNVLNRRMVAPEDFEKAEEGVRLNFEARKVWCNRYEEYMARKYKESGKNFACNLAGVVVGYTQVKFVSGGDGK